MGSLNKAHNVILVGYQRLGDAGTSISCDTGTSSETIKSFVIVAMDDNSSQILIGPTSIVASSQIRGFDAGKGLSYGPDNVPPIKLSSLFINGGASSDGVDIYAVKAG